MASDFIAKHMTEINGQQFIPQATFRALLFELDALEARVKALEDAAE